MTDRKPEKISIFGLGKLGCTTLACFAHKGWEVIGVDVNQGVVEKINEGISPIYEPGVDDLLKKNKERINATIDPQFAIEHTDVSIIIVPTPSIPDGSFSTKYVEEVFQAIGKALQKKNAYHLVVLTSTVLPGDMHRLTQLLEKTSGKACTIDFGLCYNPDFIALGNIVHNLFNPDFVLVGESDERAGALLEKLHHELVDNQPNVHRMSFCNAELTKIAFNSYCTLKITFANALAEICEKMPQGNADVVTNALGDSKRIGHPYLKGGLSYGGPCFPRDNRAFAFAAKKFGITTPLAEVTDEINNYQRDERIPGLIKDVLKEKKTNQLSVLGLTYKADTTLVMESAAISIVKALAQDGIEIRVYDPAGMEEAKVEFKGLSNIQYCLTALECIKDADVCFVASPWNEFKLLKKDDFIKVMKKPTVFDAWNLYVFTKADGIDYRQIGRNR